MSRHEALMLRSQRELPRLTPCFLRMFFTALKLTAYRSPSCHLGVPARNSSSAASRRRAISLLLSVRLRAVTLRGDGQPDAESCLNWVIVPAFTLPNSTRKLENAGDRNAGDDRACPN